MGLDMYAYVAGKKGQYNEFYETAEFDGTTNDFESKTVTKPIEIAYWRKHPTCMVGWKGFGCVKMVFLLLVTNSL